MEKQLPDEVSTNHVFKSKTGKVYEIVYVTEPQTNGKRRYLAKVTENDNVTYKLLVHNDFHNLEFKGDIVNEEEINRIIYDSLTNHFLDNKDWEKLRQLNDEYN